MSTEGTFGGTPGVGIMPGLTGSYPGQPEQTPLEAAYMRLINSYKAMQTDYRNIGFVNITVWANSCRALHEADTNLAEMIVTLHDGDTAQDFHKHRGTED